MGVDRSATTVHMPTAISILSSKGGTGKTTLATNLAGGLACLGKKTLLVDSDPQGSSVDWHYARKREWNGAPEVVSLPTFAKIRKVSHYKRAYDFVVVDGTARLEGMMVRTLRVSDLILIPIRPSPLDIWATEPLIDLIHSHQAHLQETFRGIKRLEAAFVITQQIGGSLLAKEVAGVAASLGVPVLASRTTHRVIYAQAITSGLTVQLLSPTSKAADEISRLIAEVLALLETPRR